MRNALFVAGLVVFLILLVILAHRARSRVVPPVPSAAPPPRTVGAEEPPPPPPSEPDPVPTPEPVRPEPKPESKPPEPAKDVLKIQLRDIFGNAVADAFLQIDSGAGATSLRTDSQGAAVREIWLSPTEINEAIVRVGQLRVRQPLIKGENELQIPAHQGSEFGEAAILPAEWEKTGIRRRGTDHWTSADAADPVLGRRFLFLRPGTYEISDGREGIAGRIDVIAGERATFEMKRVGAIRLDLSFLEPPKEMPASVPVDIRGVSPKATHPRSYRILMMTGNGQLSFTEYGLVPGTYEVACFDNRYSRFHETVEVAEGEIRKVEVKLVRRE